MCDWVEFEEFNGVSVVFIRNPISRFISSIPETLLRITHRHPSNKTPVDGVVVPRELYTALCSIANLPINVFIDRYITLVENGFFDGHHEPQCSFLINMDGSLRINPYVFSFEHIEEGLAEISERFFIKSSKPYYLNKGGQKGIRYKNNLKDYLSRSIRIGIYKEQKNLIDTPLAQRYKAFEKEINTRSQLLGLSNRMVEELRMVKLDHKTTERIEALYQWDMALWNKACRGWSSRDLSTLDCFLFA